MKIKTMTSRDHLALCAMQVLLKKQTFDYVPFWQRVRRFFGLPYYTCSDITDPRDLAEDAYIIADAMLEAGKLQIEEEQ